MQPPHAAKLAYQIEIHGDTIVDDYFWLRDRLGVRLRIRDRPQVMFTNQAYSEQNLMARSR
ncbi:hypothetical protein [Chamaesiphon sp. OTE_20_metabat_361]|uniref:hypothetical protein n=1 Tax=Chamaesiphon sp. OTE_20_metabat_361 TaxID=2964689 RepID=UPI00286D50A7|nr:hypothetical protein [Chamaesiphon sp. OTE_20_metabat_361]